MSALVEWNAESCAQLLKKAKKSPSGWRGCCPAHEDDNPSLFLADGTDGLALVCYAGCTYEAIAAALEARGAVLEHSHDRSSIPIEHFQLGAYSSHWDYRDTAGCVVMRICRWEQPGGRKDIRPLTRTGAGWKWAHHPAPRPLFQLDRLTNEHELPVLLVEGEKTAIAAQRLFPAYIATTWAGGAAAVGQADLSVLKGRDVVLVPDNDVAGRKAMAWWAQHLRNHARTVRTVDPRRFARDLPEGWDLADSLADGRDVSTWLVPQVEVTGASSDGKLTGLNFADMKPHLADGYDIKGLIAPNSLAAIIGHASSGKTFFAADLALHMASGQPWRGHRVRSGSVVYAALEGPVSAENRFVAARLHCGFPGSIPLTLTPGPVNLRDPADAALLIEFVRAAQSEFGLNCIAIFVDTLSRAMAGGDENGPEDMGALIAGADAVRLATGATVILVHHLGKDETRGARGHSSLKCALDTELEVSAQAGGLRIATVTKQRDFPSGTRFGFRLRVVELGRDTDGDPVTSCVVEVAEDVPTASKQHPTGKNQQLLLAALHEWKRQHPDVPAISTMEVRAIAKAQGLKDRRRLQEAIEKLQRFGWLQPSVGGYRFNAAEEVQ
jgi:hypothetical protein